MRNRMLLAVVAGIAVVAAAGGVAAGMIDKAEPAADRSGAQVRAAAGFDLAAPETVATGLRVPWGLAFLPDGSALVAERNSGAISRLLPGSAPQRVATVAGVVAAGEGGLLGLAVSPTYATDGYVYAYFTASADNRIVRLRLDAPQAQEVVLSGLAKASIHNGGRIAFGPDGMLYAGVGDAANTANSQNRQSLNGKILRLRPDGGVPADNPIPGSLVYSLGHRNVQGLAWDDRGRLFAAEFGQNTWDELNLIVAGGNYGWPTVEGKGGEPNYRDPLVVWTTAEASPSGIAVAGGSVVVAALRGARLWLVPLDPAGNVGTPTAALVGQYGRLRTVALAPDGRLWVTASNRDGRGSPAAEDDRILRFPPLAGAAPEQSG